MIDEPVDQRVTLGMAALDEQRARMGHRCRLAAKGFELGQVGCRHRRHIHQPREDGDGVGIGQRGAAGGDHHRIENDGRADLADPIRHGVGGFGGPDHPDLDRINTDVGHHRVNLRQHDVGGDGVNRCDPQSVLCGDRGDGRHRMAAEHGDGLDVGLDAGTAAGIRACDDEDARCHERTVCAEPVEAPFLFSREKDEASTSSA